MGFINIAIDGPSGAGKSTIARILAGELGYVYVDTGAMYRAVGYYVAQCGVEADNEDMVSAIVPLVDIELKYIKGIQHVYVNNKDVTAKIRTPRISEYASKVSAYSAVREHLLDLQRNIAAANNIIMDGRDIGTTVLPNAQIKIFLQADVRDRAQRRYDELCLKGEKVQYSQVLSEMRERDYRDSHREHSPLKKADDAIILDTTGNTLEKSIGEVKAIIEEKLKALSE